METLKFEMQQPNHIISLATSAILVSVDVNVWSATKQDRTISDEVTHAKKADSSAGRFVKNLLADDLFHKRVSNYRQTIYNWLKRSTFRWNNNQDLLPVINLEKFKTEFSEHETEFNRLLDSFINNYQSIVSNMAFKQGDMFNTDDYPIAQEVRNKFGIRLYVAEVPSHDWRCQISQDIATDLKSQYENQAQEIVTGILNQQVERLTEVMESISHCCGVTEVKTSDESIMKTKKRKIYDSTIEKAKDLCETFKQFKPIDNEVSRRLSEAVSMLEATLNGVDTETLRESDAVRDKVKDNVDDILSKFKL
jgi:predicted house-cleaning noncanonical NTP pyrophosphatase (MazG superfamily)